MSLYTRLWRLDSSRWTTRRSSAVHLDRPAGKAAALEFVIQRRAVAHLVLALGLEDLQAGQQVCGRLEIALPGAEVMLVRRHCRGQLFVQITFGLLEDATQFWDVQYPRHGLAVGPRLPGDLSLGLSLNGAVGCSSGLSSRWSWVRPPPPLPCN